jgi:hypothetical protein
MGSKREATRGSEACMPGVSINNDKGECTRFQGFFRYPHCSHGFSEGDGYKAMTGKAESFKAVAIEIAIFTHFTRKPAPEKRSALNGISQTPQCHGQRYAHGCWHVTIGLWAHIMQAVAG